MIDPLRAANLRLRNKKYTVAEIEEALCTYAPLRNFIIDSGVLMFYCPASECWMVDMNDDEAFDEAARHYLEIIGAPILHDTKSVESYMSKWDQARDLKANIRSDPNNETL